MVASGASEAEAFPTAQALALAQRYYRWAVLTDFALRICGQAAVDAVLKDHKNPKAPIKPDLRFYKPKNPFMPVEFSVAACRLGHSQIRSGYRLTATTGAAFFQPQPGDSNLNGFRPCHRS